MKKTTSLAVIAVGILLGGCDPKVRVSDTLDNTCARITIDEYKCGEFVSAVKEETPSNYVITVIFKKRQGDMK